MRPLKAFVDDELNMSPNYSKDCFTEDVSTRKVVASRISIFRNSSVVSYSGYQVMLLCKLSVVIELSILTSKLSLGPSLVVYAKYALVTCRGPYASVIKIILLTCPLILNQICLFDASADFLPNLIRGRSFDTDKLCWYISYVVNCIL